jgi:predicted Rossmann-fold nucleotide-binding protein
MGRVPFLLFGEEFWRRIVDWDALADAGTIAPEDLDLFRFVETADQAIAEIDGWDGAVTKRQDIPGR